MVLLVLGAAVLLSLASTVSCESHFEYINYTQILSKTTCQDYYDQVCSGWWLSQHCDSVKKQNCYTEYYIGVGVITKCQAGWQPYPGSCDIPVCDPPCEGGKSCVDPNVCGCLSSTGGLCSIVPCNDEDNCYPGTCKTSPNCTCPAPFAERNCIRILQLPDISSCRVQLYDESQALTKEADCSPVGVEPQVTWIHKPTLSKVKVVWEINYVKPVGMPDDTFAPHVANAPVPLGVRAASFNVSFSLGGGTDIVTPCVIDQSIPPQHYKKCDVDRTWSDYGVTPTHGLTFYVGAASQLGGFKEGSKTIPGSYFEKTEYRGDSTYRRAQFRFDLEPPTHCLPQNRPEDCAQFPIFLDLDVRTNPVIEPKVYNWSDDGSGLTNYHIEIFYMQTSSDNLLDNVGEALVKADVKPELNNFYYQCQKAGVYSIELTVEDQAGNRAMARELFIYTDDSDMTTDPSRPIYIAEANPGSGYTWITDVEYPQDGGPVRLTLVWTGHFKSEARFSEDWAAGVKPWAPDANRIDDKYDKQYGVRTIMPITNMPSGIVGYGVAYSVDRSNGGSGLSPDNWTTVEATTDRFVLSVPPNLKDGDAVVVWLRCYDATGSVVTEKRVFNVDTTGPDVSKQEFAQKSVDDYTSTVSVTVIDTAGGIKNISYEIYDRTVKQTVHTGIQLPQTRDPPPRNSSRSLEQPCAAGDQTCYCIPNGTCYNTIQKIDIDHCWIDLFAGDFFEFRYNVSNLGDLSKREMLELGVLTDIPCRPSPGLSPGEIAGIVIGTIVGALLIVVIVMLIRIYVFKKPPPSKLMAVHRSIQNRLGQPKTEENIVYAGGDDLGPGVNKLQNSNAALEKHGKSGAKYAYSGPEESHSSNQSANTVARKSLDFGEVLSEGRYAVIRAAYLHKGNQVVLVAAKSAKGRCPEDDKILFASKISVLEGLAPHPNVVKFLGRVEQDSNEELTMIAEYCEISLKDWLENVQRVDSEILEQMMNFTLDIAKGLQHLHTSKLVHRRLAVRNVLLKEQSGDYVAKLIGFGPNREDLGNNNNSEQITVPIKWLAPETLETLDSKTPKYDERTDAWSFGITVWEIYSKGTSPYPDHRSGDIRRLLKSGFRMSRPDNCPPEVFDSIVLPCWSYDPKARPTVASICSSIGRFRNGSDPAGYYAAGDQAVPSRTGYYDASQVNAAQAAYERVYADAE